MQPTPKRHTFRVSDDAITRPRNAAPDQDSDSEAWHVHLELQPEELMALHRLGLANSALAWRAGMHDWEPLPPEASTGREGSDSDETLGSGQHEHGGAWRRPSQPPEGKVSPFDRSRRHSTPPLAAPLAVPVLELVADPLHALPPPPPVPTRMDPLPTWPVEYPLSFPPNTALATIPHEALPSSLPPMAMELRSRTGSGKSGGGSSKALWLGAAALVALSASNGALVSALLWSLRQDGSRKATAAAVATANPALTCPSPTAAAPPAAAVPASTTVSGTDAETKPAAQALSIDQLPLMGARKREVEDRAVVAPSRSRASSTRPAGRRASIAAAAAPPAAAATTPLAAAMQEEVAQPEARTPTEPSAGPDRGAIAQAVARASAAATSCSSGPERGRVSITFAPSGSVQSVQLLQGFGDASTNSCVLRAMGRAHVPAFSGSAVTVKKGLSW